MKFGLTEQQYAILEKLLIQPLRAKNAKIYIFGSRARGKHHAFSDIDLVYEEDPDSPLSTTQIAEIKEALENSALIIKVDLVKDTDLAQSYRKSVDADKILISD